MKVNVFSVISWWWKNRKHINELQNEIKVVKAVIDDARADGKITKKEMQDILKEISPVIERVIVLLD
jgi:hypothetical protein